MVSWKNFDKLDSYGKLQAVKKVNLQEAMAGESGAERVKKYAVPMAAGLTYNFAAKAVDDAILKAAGVSWLKRKAIKAALALAPKS